MIIFSGVIACSSLSYGQGVVTRSKNKTKVEKTETEKQNKQELSDSIKKASKTTTAKQEVSKTTAIQQSSPSNSSKDEIFADVDQVPEFPGGMPNLMKFLSANIQYPEAAQKNEIQGRVILKFVVSKDGSIDNITVEKSVSKDLDEEAIRVVKKMPKWVPGIKDNLKVNCYCVLPINFKLS